MAVSGAVDLGALEPLGAGVNQVVRQEHVEPHGRQGLQHGRPEARNLPAVAGFVSLEV